MKKSMVWCLVAAMAVLAGGCREAGVDEQVAAPSPPQQAAAPSQTAVEESVPAEPKVAPEQQAVAEKLGLPVVITNSIEMKLVLIPAGEFLMGSPEGDEDRSSLDNPQHRVRITQPFYLGVYEVSQSQYARVMGTNPPGSGSQRPRGNVTWDEAVKFCDKLSALPEEKAAGRVYRLPTEAQWEYACRAKTTEAYSFGNDESKLGTYAWFSDYAGGAAHAVGQKQPNGFGLFDMHGNLWEWCQDWYAEDYYQNSPTDDPQGPAAGSGHVYRGGSVISSASDCRSASRFSGLPVFCSFVGFRVAAVPAASPASQTSPGSEAASESR